MAKKTTAAIKKAPEPQQPPPAEASGDDVINGKLAEINALISPYQLAWVSPEGDCELLVKNARYMTKEQLDRLTENVKGDGFLSQIPFCIKEANGKYRVLSGNHRVKSAIKAGLPKILVMFGDESDFDEQRQMAIQLSHNAISGQDDLAILKELYLSLKDLQLKAYSGINEAELMAYKAFDFAAISEQDIALNEINFMFSDANVKDVEKVLDALDKKGVDPEKDALVLGDVDRFIETMTRVKKRLNIKNRSVALLAMCRICEEYLNEAEGEERQNATNTTP